MTDVTLSEMIGMVVFLGGLGLSCWALVDDIWDLTNVYRFGEVGGPRWVSAMEHFLFNGSMLLGWAMLLGLTGIAIYLPSRQEPNADTLGFVAGWLRLGAGFAFLTAQIHRRVGRVRLQRLPLEAWETMLASMFDGMSVQDRTTLLARLLRVSHAGREMGHLIANTLQQPVATLSILQEDRRLTDEERADIAASLDALDMVGRQVQVLHSEIRSNDPDYTQTEPLP